MHRTGRGKLLGLSLLMLICATPCGAQDGLHGEDDAQASPAAQPAESGLPELERSDHPGDAVADPLSAWAAARELVQPGGTVRRIAFARHGVFLCHSRPGIATVENVFIGWEDGAYHAEMRSEMDPGLFKAPGVDPERIAPALKRLQETSVWRQHAAQLDSFFLEGMREQMTWVLMPIPAGGYREGVAIPTYDVAFE
jgi:hypothetical protein